MLMKDNKANEDTNVTEDDEVKKTYNRAIYPIGALKALVECDQDFRQQRSERSGHQTNQRWKEEKNSTKNKIEGEFEA